MNVTADYALHQLPMFMRAGSVLPLRTFASLQHTAAFSDPLVWTVFPGGGVAASGEGAVVEDDGTTLRFESDNATATTAMTWNTTTTGFTATVAPTVGTFDLNRDCGNADPGFAYGGAGADLQVLDGTVSSAGACCEACTEFSNCAYWTWFNSTRTCTLKVSRRGRTANSDAISGVAARRMPTSRAHGFQFRVGVGVKADVNANAVVAPSRAPAAAGAFSAVTVNGESLAQIAPAADGAVGWYVQPTDAVSGLAKAPVGTLVMLTDSIDLDRAVVVHITRGNREEVSLF
jgi:hypothetical protein